MQPQPDATELAQRLTSRSEDERKAAADASRTIGAPDVKELPIPVNTTTVGEATLPRPSIRD